MERFTSIAETTTADTQDTLSLPFAKRQISRQRATTCSGTAVFVELPRGTVMRNGQTLESQQGTLLRVVASFESVSTVTTDSPSGLAKIAYHLGNRHVSLQVGNNWVRYLQDAVLDNMVAGLGLEAVIGSHPFEPESGAYSHGGHSHGGHGHGGHSH